ncbi:MAG TPA: hypothetical protein VFS44_07960, partial [Gemmatimonadaceae bacterium]|nr:hypothetical protein [Gemmatimonadaceae bacterium]
MQPNHADIATSLALPEEDESLRAEVNALRFLVHAGTVLGRSLDLGTTLARAAAAPVPALSDWCVVYLAGSDRRLERREGAAASRRGEVLMRDALTRRAIAPEADGAIARVARTGLTEVVPHDPTAPAASIGSMDPALGTLGEALGAGTSLVLSLQAKGRSLGALVLTD